jgi:hypothetical protein
VFEKSLVYSSVNIRGSSFFIRGPALSSVGFPLFVLLLSVALLCISGYALGSDPVATRGSAMFSTVAQRFEETFGRRCGEVRRPAPGAVEHTEEQSA